MKPHRSPFPPALEVLLSKLDDFMRMKNMALATRRQYGQWARRYAVWLREPWQAELQSASAEEKMEAFLTWLVVEKDVAASTQNVAFSALLFLYRDFQKQTLRNVDALRSKRPVFIKTSLPPEQVVPVLNDVRDEGGQPLALILWTIYGCGLRLNEALNLRLKDVQLSRGQLIIQEAKHNHGRVVPMPCRIMPAIEWQIKAAKLVAEKDRMRGLPLQLPRAIARKDLRAPFREPWAFLFPSARPMREPDTDRMMRWHVPDYAVQRALKAAAEKHGLDGLLTPHILRHCFATDFAHDVKLLAEILGHKDVRTTMGYRHPQLAGAKLPLDLLPSAPLTLAAPQNALQPIAKRGESPVCR